MTQRATNAKQERPRKTTSIQRAQSRQGDSRYPQHNFNKWEAEFNRHLRGGSKAEKGLKKWIDFAKAARESTITRAKNHFENHGLDVDAIERLHRPEDTRADVMKDLWIGSAPNVKERTRATKAGKQLLKQMEKLAESVDHLATRLQKENAKLMTQDGFLEIPVDGVLQHCIQLSSSIRTTSMLVKRKHIYPLDIADCCMSLVITLEDRWGLSQRECHALIECALFAHGCTEDEAAPFGTGSVERGTIGAKKEAIRQKVMNSTQFLYRHTSKS